MSARTRRSPIRRSTSGHEHAMVDAVEARLDVRFDDPLVVRGSLGEVVNLGDGVLCSASWSVAVGRDVEAGLEDRLQHQLEGHLHHPVLECGNPQPADLAAFLGDAPLPDRERFERAVLELLTELDKEPLSAVVVLDEAACKDVDSRRA